jgi:hypothetical protein
MDLPALNQERALGMSVASHNFYLFPTRSTNIATLQGNSYGHQHAYFSHVEDKYPVSKRPYEKSR